MYVIPQSKGHKISHRYLESYKLLIHYVGIKISFISMYYQWFNNDNLELQNIGTNFYLLLFFYIYL